MTNDDKASLLTGHGELTAILNAIHGKYLAEAQALRQGFAEAADTMHQRMQSLEEAFHEDLARAHAVMDRVLGLDQSAPVTPSPPPTTPPSEPETNEQNLSG